MASNGLAEAFTRLSTSGSRLNALEALIKELTPYEWRFVQSLTNTRTFQCDIIGRLPIELVSHIFSYLDTSTPWRLQLVSRSWSEKLRSLVVLKPGLDSWYDGTVNLQDANLDFCWHKARSIHAFRHASQSAPPDSSFKISAPFYLGEQILAGDNLIWLDKDRRQVHVLNLRSLTHKVLVSMARGMLRNLYASDELVVFTPHTSGTVYVGELDGQNPLKQFRVINSALNFAVTCRHRTVACAQYLQGRIHVYIWNYDTQQGRSFNISNDTPMLSGDHPNLSIFSGLGLLLQPDTETIVLCLFVQLNSERNPGNNPQVLYYRFTYAGEYLHGAKQVLDGYYDDINIDFGDRTSLKFIPASHDGLFMLQCNAWVSSYAIKTVHTLQFDENLHAFTSPRHSSMYPVDQHDQGNIVWWKNVFIEAGTKENIVVHRGATSYPRHDPAVAYIHIEPVRRADREQQINFKDLLLNDMYVVRPYCDAFYVYCYDHTVQLPGKEGTLDGVGPWEVIEPRFASVSECVGGAGGT